MGKTVTITEFKADLARLVAETKQDGELITLTKRGKVVGMFRLSGPNAE